MITNLHVGNRTFNATDFRNEPLVYDVLTPPHTPANADDATILWALSNHPPFIWHWTSTLRTLRYETRILTNLRVHLDPGVDPLDFHLTFTVSGSRYVHAPLHGALSMDFIEPCLIEEQSAVTFQLTSQKRYDEPLRMQFIFAGYRKQVVT